MDEEERTLHVLLGCVGCRSDSWHWGTGAPEDEHAVCGVCGWPQPPNSYHCYRFSCTGEVILRHEQ